MDSPEYKTVKHCFPKLVNCFRQSPEDIADLLGLSEILAPEDLLSETKRSSDEKARLLVDTVLIKVKNDLQEFDKLLATLKSGSCWANSAASQLEGTYLTLYSVVKAQSSKEQGEFVLIPCFPFH